MSKNKQWIHIIDDDVSVGRALSLLLGTYGYDVDTFISAEDFFRTFPGSVRGGILLDIFMPKMDGWQALKQIVKRGLGQRVILISADKNGGFKKRAVEAGAFGYLKKPFDDRELIDLIEDSFENEKA